MRIYIFKSETRQGLRAFAKDVLGSELPARHGPWTATGIVGQHGVLPFKMSRAVVETAIEANGFQLWRPIKKATA